MAASAESDLDRLAGAVVAAVGEEVALIGGWWSPQVVPAPIGMIPVRLVFSYTAERVAGLRSWRDGVELVVASELRDLHVVAYEASKWARLALKQHPCVQLWAASGHVVGDRDLIGGAAALLAAAPSFEAWDRWVGRCRRSAATLVKD